MYAQTHRHCAFGIYGTQEFVMHIGVFDSLFGFDLCGYFESSTRLFFGYFL